MLYVLLCLQQGIECTYILVFNKLTRLLVFFECVVTTFQLHQMSKPDLSP